MALLLLLSGVLAACGGSGSASKGVLTGGVIYVGGPAPGLSAASGYQPGDVEVVRGGTTVAHSHVGTGQPYRFNVAAGDYTVRVRLGDCTAHATVYAGRTTKADVTCSIS